MSHTHFFTNTIPAALRAIRQWVCWRPVERDGRLTKLPLSPQTGQPAKANDPTTWAPFEVARRVAHHNGWGIGYEFSIEDPHTGVDLDRCHDPNTGELAPWARDIVRELCSYTEVSPSKTGLHIVVEGKLQGADGRRKGAIEIYSARRFFCVTGQLLPGAPTSIEHRQSELDALIATLFPPEPCHNALVETRETSVLHDDDQVIQRALRARNGGKFGRLWRGEWQADYASRSEADAALVAMLAFWVGSDAARIDSLFRQSGLCREKWLSREDYRERTLQVVLLQRRGQALDGLLIRELVG